MCLWGILALILAPAVTMAEWPTQPHVNLPIDTNNGTQTNPQIISDGSGGAIIVWENQASSPPLIYAQRVDADGKVLWNNNGVIVCNFTHTQAIPQLVSDGDGGAIVSWVDARGSDAYSIYAQHIDKNGLSKWGNGVKICDATGEQYDHRVNILGEVLWSDNGVYVCGAGNHQLTPQLVSDGAGGAIFTWADERAGNSDIYAQHLNASGAKQWLPGGSDGLVISDAVNGQTAPQIVNAADNGVIIVWEDRRYGNSSTDIYALRVNPDGSTPWGLSVCLAALTQQKPQLTGDGAGGAIVAWEDGRRGTGETDIFVQRIAANGNRKWGENGVNASNVSTTIEGNPQLVSDSKGGAVITWYDSRSASGWDIYAQRVSSTGVNQWGPNGAPVSTASGFQSNQHLISDGASGAIVTWIDPRQGNQDIYAQRIFSGGALSPSSPIFFPVRTKSNKTAIIFLE